ncbi:disease resistance protein RPV1-like [Eucalyptus grandis]|uniref:disease resistance protein RPV1-like n=1 Tax=Eucalyptus grandis TaxID=71139 RepID=UPI00192E8DC5|nr:disease resistance protein RPV1-like [Eucalyptus grandis]
MHRLILGHSFVELVALILLLGLASFYFLNKKKANVHGNAENSDTGTCDSLTTPTETNSSVSSSTPIETTNGVSSSSTESSGNYYDVFLSFSGKDTRNSFTGHLYHKLIDAGISTFRDNNELHQGKKIGPDLFAAIENSKISIPVLSVNYGTSNWCLNELVRMMECQFKTEHIVLPIFYKVQPSHVRDQTGDFGDAFLEYEGCLLDEGFDPMRLEKWKKALTDVSGLKGWPVTGPEGELVNSVVQEVLNELFEKFELDTPENLTGIDSHVEKVMKSVANNSHAPYLLASMEWEALNSLINDILKKKDQVRDKDAGIKYLSSIEK